MSTTPDPRLELIAQLDPVEVVQLLEREYIHRLIFGNLISVREIWLWTRHLELPQPPSVVLLAEIDGFTTHADSLSQTHRRRAKAEATQALRTVVRGEGCLVTPWDGGRIIALFSPEPSERAQEAQERVMELARRMQRTVREETRLSLSIGVSTQHKDSRRLTTAYTEAVAALESKFYAGSGSILRFCPDTPFQQQALLLRGEELEVLQAFRAADEAATVRAVAAYLQVLRKRRVLPARVRTAAVDMLLLLMREVFDVGASGPELMTAYQAQLAEIGRCEEFTQVVELTSAMALDLLNLSAGELGRRGAGEVVRQALWLIRTGYSHHLTLESLAARLNMSPSYLSRQFKAIVGENFNAYLARTRLEAAQRLLTHTDLPIGQIAFRTGFAQQAHFTRHFRQAVGMTPSEFRSAYGDPLRVRSAQDG